MLFGINCPNPYFLAFPILYSLVWVSSKAIGCPSSVVYLPHLPHITMHGSKETIFLRWLILPSLVGHFTYVGWKEAGWSVIMSGLSDGCVISGGWVNSGRRAIITGIKVKCSNNVWCPTLTGLLKHQDVPTFRYTVLFLWWCFMEQETLI